MEKKRTRKPTDTKPPVKQRSTGKKKQPKSPHRANNTKKKQGESSVRSQFQKERDERIIVRLYASGLTQAEIPGLLQKETGESYSISQSVISRTLTKVRNEWAENTQVDLDQYKKRELAKIDAMEWEYWEAWRKSKRTFESRTIKAKKNKSENSNKLVEAGAEQSLKTEERVGNPAYLQGVERCIRLRMEILDILKPGNQNFFQFNFELPGDEVLNSLPLPEDAQMVVVPLTNNSDSES